MKYILLILAAAGLTACSNGVVKNESGAEISVEGNPVNEGACYEWTVVLGFIGNSSVAIKTTGDSPTQIGDKEAYDVGYYVVKSTANEAAAVESKDEAPQCEPVEGDDPEVALAEAKQAAGEAADAAVAAADAAVAKAESMQPHPGPPAFLTQEKIDAAKAAAAAAKAKADEAKAEADAAETVEAADAAKAKADEAKAEAGAV